MWFFLQVWQGRCFSFFYIKETSKINGCRLGAGEKINVVVFSTTVLVAVCLGQRSFEKQKAKKGSFCLQGDKSCLWFSPKRWLSLPVCLLILLHPKEFKSERFFKDNNIFVYQDLLYLVFNRRGGFFFFKMNNESQFLAIWRMFEEKVQRCIYVLLCSC